MAPALPVPAAARGSPDDLAVPDAAAPNTSRAAAAAAPAPAALRRPVGGPARCGAGEQWRCCLAAAFTPAVLAACCIRFIFSADVRHRQVKLK